MNLLLAISVFAQRRSDAYDAGVFAGGMCCCFFFPLMILGMFVPMMIGMYKVYEKAGQPGWAALVPFYNMIILVKIVGQDDMRWLFYLIPIAGIIFYAQDLITLAQCFGKDSGFAIGMLLLAPVFWPILGFGDARYTPPPSRLSGPPAY
jgi:hypothetical protein